MPSGYVLTWNRVTLTVFRVYQLSLIQFIKHTIKKKFAGFIIHAMKKGKPIQRRINTHRIEVNSVNKQGKKLNMSTISNEE